MIGGRGWGLITVGVRRSSNLVSSVKGERISIGSRPENVGGRRLELDIVEWV